MSATATETVTNAPSTLKVDNSTYNKDYKNVEMGVQNLAFGGGDDLEFKYARPTFTDKYAERKWALEHMAAAFRFLARHDYNEGAAGHISIRDPVDPHTFWINPLGRHFGLMKASDMVHVDDAGNVIGGNRHVINGAGFKIHSELHKARPDVHAAVHSHSVWGKAYAAFGKPLEMLNQDACIFHNSHSVYTEFGGVVLETEEGKRLAKALGDGKGVLLQNHGHLTVGQTVDEAVYLFSLMEKTCKVQMLADQYPGKKILVKEEEAAYTHHMTSDPESLYLEFQPDYEYELETSNGAFLFKE